MSTDETYNGWTNRETWAVALHINNDQGWQEQVHEAIREKLTDEGEAYSFGEVDDNLRARWAGDGIRENVEENLLYGQDAQQAQWMPSEVDLLVTLIHDIGSLWRVNWAELGASFLSDLEEN